jgi:hypothetical protein
MIILIFYIYFSQFFMFLEFSYIRMRLGALSVLADLITDLISAERTSAFFLDTPHHYVFVAILGLLEYRLGTLKPLPSFFHHAVIGFS